MCGIQIRAMAEEREGCCNGNSGGMGTALEWELFRIAEWKVFEGAQQFHLQFSCI